MEDLGIDGGNFKMVLKEIGWESVDLIYLAQNRDQLVGLCEYSNESLGFYKCKEFLA
jgi:hypothetical protein